MADECLVIGSGERIEDQCILARYVLVDGQDIVVSGNTFPRLRFFRLTQQCSGVRVVGNVMHFGED